MELLKKSVGALNLFIFIFFIYNCQKEISWKVEKRFPAFYKDSIKDLETAAWSWGPAQT